MKHYTKYWRNGVATIALIFGLITSLPPVQAGNAIQRPIEDFVEAQGTYCLDDGSAACFLFVPPIQNFLGWEDPVQERCASIDYAGLADRWLTESGDSVGTQFYGSITERPMADGRAEVLVNLQTKNALTWVAQGELTYDEDENETLICDSASAPLLFGHRAPDVLYGGEEPALCDAYLLVKFINTVPGAPLPDLIQLSASPEEGQELTSIAMRCSTKGPLREDFGVEDGTPGRVVLTQTGLLINQRISQAAVRRFPVEFIYLEVLGKK